MISQTYKNEKVTNKEEVNENKVLHKQLIENGEYRIKLAPALTQLGIPLNEKVLNILQKEIVTISNKFPEENIIMYIT